MAKTLTKVKQQIKRKKEDERSCELYVEDPQVFKVEKILDIRGGETKIEYLIKWKGYASKFNEWVDENNVTPDIKRLFSLDSLTRANRNVNSRTNDSLLSERKKKQIKRLQVEREKYKRESKLLRVQNATLTPKRELKPFESFRKVSDTVGLESKPSKKALIVQQLYDAMDIKLESSKSVKESLIASESQQQSCDAMDMEFESAETLKGSLIANESPQLLPHEMDAELDEYVNKLLQTDLEPFLLGFNKLLEPVVTFDLQEFPQFLTELKELETRESELESATLSGQQPPDHDGFGIMQTERNEKSLLGFNGTEPFFE